MLSPQVLQETFAFPYSSNLDIRSIAGSSLGISCSYTYILRKAFVALHSSGLLPYILQVWPRKFSLWIKKQWSSSLVFHPTVDPFLTYYSEENCWQKWVLNQQSPTPSSQKQNVIYMRWDSHAWWHQMCKSLRSQLVSLCCPRFLFVLLNEDRCLPVSVACFFPDFIPFSSEHIYRFEMPTATF